MKNESLLPIAKNALLVAQKKGVKTAAITVTRERSVDYAWRDGKVESVSDATSRHLTAQFFVDGRYSTASTSDLRPEALEKFFENGAAMTRLLTADPFRGLPEAALYEGASQADLQLFDAQRGVVDAAYRARVAKAIEEGARSEKSARDVLSVSANVSESETQWARVHSDGFASEREGTSFSINASCSVKDADDRRPEDYAYASTRFLADLPEPGEVGRDAMRRTTARLGAKKSPSARVPMIVEARSVGRLLGMLMGPLSGQALQQKRSFFEGKIGTPVASKMLTVVDDPLLPRGLSSRPVDGEGIALRRRPILENGVLRTAFIDTYYGRKGKLPITTGTVTNVLVAPGSKKLDELVAGIQDGFLVTSFNGGNSNATTGDFSVGVSGYRIRKGERAEPVNEMNIAGNHLTFWNQIAAVGADVFPYGSVRAPSLVFENVQFAGT